MNIEDLGLSMRAYKVLKRNGINTLEELMQQTEDSLIRMRDLGRKTLEEVLQVIKDHEQAAAPEQEAATNYDVTMSFTIHCKDAEERDAVLKRLKSMEHLVLHG